MMNMFPIDFPYQSMGFGVYNYFPQLNGVYNAGRGFLNEGEHSKKGKSVQKKKNF